uniref:molecular chaperone HtpG n=1 Tax=Porphyromonas loveana TaxID=1884669 RepID=UPI0035A09415
HSDHDIFLRELVSNAVDATQKLRTLAVRGEVKEDIGTPQVRVSFDSEAKTITVSDQGIGMTEEEVERYINQIAFSSAEEFLDKYKDNGAAIIGHFGMGFYSAFMVSERVDIITRSYKEGAQAVKWSCDGSPHYTLEPAEKAERGTEIILHIDEESKEFLAKDRLEGLLNKYCKFLNVPVVFGKKQEWKDGKYVDTDEDNQINNTTPAWTRKPSELTDEDYKNFYRELYPMSMEEPLFWIHLNVDYPFNLTGILYFPKIKNNLELQRNKIQLYSNQVYVTDEVQGIVPDFLTLLHGVIDSPDIPLNVSRSYLQSDSNVKKISAHITKKVADRLEEIFKNDRPTFEEKWDSLRLFVQYGMLTDEKFYDRATKFFLLSDIEGHKYTLDEYRTLVEGVQTDRDGQVVYLYATDREAQYSHVKRATDKGYSVLVLDGQLDTHTVSQLERKLEKTHFVRVDSDTINNLIRKEQPSSEVKLSDVERSSLIKLFEARLPREEKKHFNVAFESLGTEAEAVLITQGEFMRRMRDMAQLQPGMSFYGELPDSYNLVLNADHPLIARVLAREKEAVEPSLTELRARVAELQAEEQKLSAEVQGKKPEEIPAATKEAQENNAMELAKTEGSINEQLTTYAQGNELIGQLIDLALLGSGLLTGEPLAEFIRRSQRLL